MKRSSDRLRYILNGRVESVSFYSSVFYLVFFFVFVVGVTRHRLTLQFVGTNTHHIVETTHTHT